MHNTKQIVKLLFLMGVTMVLLAALVYGVLYFLGKAGEVTEDTKFEVYERFANRYRSQLLTYTGVCNDMKPIPPVVCEDSADAFRVYEQLHNGMYNCTDVHGYQGHVESLPRNSLSCR